ncbi:hypothetical protein LAG90_14390 [Marinilongibacter aquaticus]|uniref:GDSL-type esterase/lipase family protein n=1 Tax=Marinilongibacter aquaticus TaxID=2975157 RepID=UPI0021BD4BA8|nr:GDSL-type esterase/lipase family protein [Marinilongibacter aquaticus]UBM57994.1 hypothetical protein LAG90_14390 [Marinilongibacter aquaticus]
MRKYMAFGALLVMCIAACSPYKKYAETEEPWEDEVYGLELLDDQETYSDDAVLFIGSSSIRLWKTIKEDMAPYEPIRRGYGGAHFSDLIHFTKRLVYPHHFRALCIFVANDITGGKDDLSVHETMRLFKEVVNTVRVKYPDVPIFPIAVTPTNSRWKVWPTVEKLNAKMASYCQSHANMYFINPGEAYIGEDGKPISALFREDQLHQNEEGYDIWAKYIKAELDRVLK